MRDLEKRLSKGLVVSLMVHLALAVAIGIWGYRFVDAKPQILEVALIGGGFAVPQEEVIEIPEEKPIPKKVDDIIDPKLKPKPKKQVVKPKQTQKKDQAPVNSKGSTPSVAKGDGSGEGKDTGSIGGKGSGSAKESDRGVPIVPPRVLSSVRPKYPASAREEGIEGITYVKMLVGIDGKVEEAFIVTSSGNKEMDEEALKAVRKWRFSPSKDKYGQKARCYVTQGIRFDLN